MDFSKFQSLEEIEINTVFGAEIEECKYFFDRINIDKNTLKQISLVIGLYDDNHKFDVEKFITAAINSGIKLVRIIMWCDEDSKYDNLIREFLESNSYQFDVEIGESQALTIHGQIVSCRHGKNEYGRLEYLFEIRNSNWKIENQSHMLAFCDEIWDPNCCYMSN